jgi:hypothetical protein
LGREANLGADLYAKRLVMDALDKRELQDLYEAFSEQQETIQEVKEEIARVNLNLIATAEALLSELVAVPRRTELEPGASPEEVARRRELQRKCRELAKDWSARKLSIE